MNILRKLFICPFGMCAHAPKSDDTGCWGECIHCRKRTGFVDRAALRAYADAEYAEWEASKAKQQVGA
jgi:hypothetical protein